MVQRKFDAIHEFHGSWTSRIESAAVDYQTIIPLIMNDDAQGDPMSLNVHPEHASWAERDRPNCYPDSEIKNFKFTLDVIAPKTIGGEIPNVAFQYALVSCAFPEDLDALDEKSGLTLKEVIEVQKETTDRQCYPLWNNVDLITGSDLHDEVPGLTTNQTHEAVAWNPEIVKDQMRYGRIKGLLKKVLPIGIRTSVINFRSTTGGHRRITIRFVPSNAKFINPYTFLGCMVRTKQVAASTSVLISDIDQLINPADTSATSNVIFAWHCQYNERNPEFHMAKV